MSGIAEPATPRHIVGIDFGTTNVRVHVAHYSAGGEASGEPSLVYLPGSERDGALPSILELDETGALRAFGLPAMLNMQQGDSARFVSEFKPCIGQTSEDLSAQGRPERARFCSNPECLHPGWAWSVAMRFCGFCGGPLEAATTSGARWQPTFRYSQAEALNYTKALLTQISRRLETQFGEAIKKEEGWMVAAGVPVHWQKDTLTAYEEVLQEAFPQAGISLVHEPTGALRYYGQHDLLRTDTAGKHGWTLVVDFGGGTTDLVLAQADMSDGVLRVGDVRPYGERYGGADFDLVLAHYAAGELGVTLDGGLFTHWKLKAREWKEAFSARVQQDTGLKSHGSSASSGDPSVTVSFPVPKASGLFENAPVTLKRSVFNRVAGDLVERFRSVLERGLQHFGVAPSDIEQVVLTGGGAHWYFVQETVAQFLPDAKMLAGVEPEMSISKGLALGALNRHRPAWMAEAPVVETDIARVLRISPAEAIHGGSFTVEAGDHSVPVTLPSFSYNGQVIRIEGAGAAGKGGIPGDLVITVEVVAKPPVRGEDLHAELVLTPAEALEGGSKHLLVADTGLPVTFPPNTRDGDQIVVEYAGSPGTFGGESGSLFVAVKVSSDQAAAAPAAQDLVATTVASPEMWAPPPGATPAQTVSRPSQDPSSGGVSRRSLLLGALVVPIVGLSGFIAYHFATSSARTYTSEPPPPPPPGGPPAPAMISVRVCQLTSLLPTIYCPHIIGKTFLQGEAPTTHCPVHIGPTCPVCGKVYPIGFKYCPLHYPPVRLTGP